MILCVTLNAAIDKTYIIEGFKPGEIFRIRETQALAGGKGINVSRVIHSLGGDVLATGFLGGHNGAFIEERLAAEGIPASFVRVKPESRVTISIIDPASSSETGLYENGPSIAQEDWERFKDHFANWLNRTDMVILSGSLPAGLPSSAYAELIRMARARQRFVILDTSGKALQVGLAAHPWMAKPNRAEAEELLGRPLHTQSSIVESIQKLLADGLEAIAVSLGSEGVIGGCRDGIWSVQPPPVKAKSSVGAGDSFVAGFALSWLKQGDFAEALRYATACATASVIKVGAGILSPVDVQHLTKIVKAEKIA